MAAILSRRQCVNHLFFPSYPDPHGFLLPECCAGGSLAAWQQYPRAGAQSPAGGAAGSHSAGRDAGLLQRPAHHHIRHINVLHGTVTLWTHEWTGTENCHRKSHRVCSFMMNNVLRFIYDTNGLVQDCGNSSVSALELLQSCTKPLIQSIMIVLFIGFYDVSVFCVTVLMWRFVMIGFYQYSSCTILISLKLLL